MSLDPGLFCIVQTPARGADVQNGLPGVRLSLPPGMAERSDRVSISGFRPDGWLNSAGDAALVRVAGGPAQILVTVYQAQGLPDAAPSLQVLRLLEPGGAAAAGGPQPQADAAPRRAPEVMDLLAHIQGRGDTGGRLGEWLGTIGSKAWIEGIAIAPTRDIDPDDIEYQAVLGRGWLSPWVEGGQFCGSRGMALPLLGLRVRLRGKAAEAFECVYSASFVDGTQTGPMGDGEPCESESLAAIEAINVSIRAKGSAAATNSPSPAAPAKPIAKPAAPPSARGRPSR
jgi:hypothetical protein